MRQFARIEALQEQESWLSGIKNQIGDLEAEIARLEGEFSGEWKQLGLNDDADSAGWKSFRSGRSPRCVRRRKICIARGKSSTGSKPKRKPPRMLPNRWRRKSPPRSPPETRAI